jgi:hypothetical protein
LDKQSITIRFECQSQLRQQGFGLRTSEKDMADQMRSQFSRGPFKKRAMDRVILPFVVEILDK